MGIAFQAEQGMPVSQEETDKDTKIRELEAEVARLKAEVGVLRNRLFGHEGS